MRLKFNTKALSRTHYIGLISGLGLVRHRLRNTKPVLALSHKSRCLGLTWPIVTIWGRAWPRIADWSSLILVLAYYTTKIYFVANIPVLVVCLYFSLIVVQRLDTTLIDGYWLSLRKSRANYLALAGQLSGRCMKKPLF